MSSYTDLADAIVRGAAIRPQVHGEFFGGITNPFGSCVWGAAWEGQHGEVEDLFECKDIGLTTIFETFAIARSLTDGCPVPECTTELSSLELYDVSVHLNDEHTWSRESVAAFVRGLDGHAEH
jgi:hypothetical protein